MLKIGQYIEQKDGTYKCKFCGSKILAVEFLSGLIPEVETNLGTSVYRGPDERKNFRKIPYCPKCEEKPGSERMKCF